MAWPLSSPPVPWLAAPVTLALLLLGLLVHRRVRGLLPEDRPRGGRRQHRQPTPMAGGLLGAGISVYLLAAGLPWLGAATATAWLVGLLDDLHKDRDRELGWPLKAIALVIAAGLGTAHVAATLPGLVPRDLYLLFLFLFAVTNACNFLDNTDGVAASLVALAILLVTGGAGALAAIGFACLGFLPLNWPRPVLFLGDAGSLTLGICAGAAAATALPDWQQTLAPVAIPLLDFTQVLIARLCLNLPPWVGDRRHLTHIATNLGLPRILVAPLFATLAYGAWRAIAAA